MPELKLPDINNILIAGTLTNDPADSQDSKGTPVVNFFITSNKRYRDNSGIRRESTCQVGVIVHGQLANACKNVLTKGNAVAISGELQINGKTNEEGSSKSIVEIKAQRIQFLNPESDTKADKFKAVPQINGQDIQKETTAEIVNTQEIQIELTEFDFGYQDLKL